MVPSHRSRLLVDGDHMHHESSSVGKILLRSRQVSQGKTNGLSTQGGGSSLHTTHISGENIPVHLVVHTSPHSSIDHAAITGEQAVIGQPLAALHLSLHHRSERHRRDIPLHRRKSHRNSYGSSTSLMVGPALSDVPILLDIGGSQLRSDAGRRDL